MKKNNRQSEKKEYLAGLRAGVKIPGSELAEKITEAGGGDIGSIGKVTVTFMATPAVVKEMRLKLAKICVIGKGVKFRPVTKD